MRREQENRTAGIRQLMYSAALEVIQI